MTPDAQFALDFVAPSRQAAPPDNGWAGAEKGIKRSADHAENEAPGWSDRALTVLREFLALHPGKELIAPQVRDFAAQRGLPNPPTNYAWGGVFLRASRMGLIRRCGFTTYGDRTMHTQSVAKWTAA